jgi:hypothetical protein
MSDHFKYFLKPEERKTSKIKNRPTRKWNVIFTLSNVALLLLIIFLVYKPAMDRLNKENKVFIDGFSIDIDFELTENNLFVNLYIFNESRDNYFDFSRLSCSLVFASNEEIFPLNIREDKELINQNSGIHYILSFSLKEKKSSTFFIKLKYDNKTIYESKTIKSQNQ